MTAIDRYFAHLNDLITRVHSSQQAQMESASQRVFQAIRDGHLLYTFGTGHGHLLALEVFYRAGGMAPVCPILDEKLMLHISASGSTMEERKEDWVPKLLRKYPIAQGDVLFIFSNSGRNAVPVLLAKAARERGAFVIALTSMAHTASVTSRNSLGLRLFEVADLVLDNGGVPGDAALQFSDGSFVGPTSTAVGAAILQSIVCRVKEIALEQGILTDFFVSSNLDGGDEINEKLIEKYAARVPGLK